MAKCAKGFLAAQPPGVCCFLFVGYIDAPKKQRLPVKHQLLIVDKT
jgi:hypothetical protein